MEKTEKIKTDMLRRGAQTQNSEHKGAEGSFNYDSEGFSQKKNL